MKTIDCLVMGRNTFETVKSFDGEWPYDKKVFVVSNSMKSIPNGYEDKAELIKGLPSDIVMSLKGRGYNNLYIDGGKTIQNFLKEDLIDEMIITTIPTILGGGKSLFGELSESKKFKLLNTKVVSEIAVQNHYKFDNG
jgi:dihydrofolate reductase